MKKTILFLFAISVVVMANAQLKVDSIGRIRLNNSVALGSATNFSVNAGLQTIRLLNYGNYIGLYSELNSQRNLYTDRQGSAIFGKVKYAGNGPVILNSDEPRAFSNIVMIGVAGVAEYGVGIYGATGSALPTSGLGTYAGYFSGDVKATGTMTAASFVTSSDRRLKTNISSLSSADALYRLRPVSYNFSLDTMHLSYKAESQEYKNIHYGLIAQEVKEVLPNLVYENQTDDYLSVNYLELIPLLISAVQEQNERIAELEEQLATEKNSPSRKQANEPNESMVAKLFQNNPNPFTQATEIEYELPAETKSAAIHIYNMVGTEIAVKIVTEFGRGKITIDGGNLTAGMYLYSLIADGKIIDTKQMILTK